MKANLKYKGRQILFEMKKVSPHGIGGPLEPVRIINSLFRRQYPDKRPGEIVKPVGIIYVVI